MSFAFVFPGQGSQSVGMMAAYGDLAEVRATFAEASDALGEDLWAMAAEGPAERLAQTVNTQPLMLTAGIAVWRAWLAAGGEKPVVLAGHSLGEYSALVASGALGFADGVRLVRLRAQAMQQAVPAGVGGMAAILGLEAARVVEICEQAAQGAGRFGGQPERPEAGRHCRPRRSGGPGLRSGQGGRSQKGSGAAGQRPLPLRPDAPGRRTPGRGARDGRISHA